MEYNNSGNLGCRIGNWVEEMHIEGLECSDRFQETRQRVVPPVGGKSEKLSSTVLSDYRYPRDQTRPINGSRDKMLQDKFLKEAMEECKREEEAKEEKQQFFVSSTKSSFQAPTDSFRREYVIPGRKVMKQQTGENIRLAPKEHFTFTQEDLAGDVPVSIYSHRLAEGSFKTTPNTNKNPFARNCGFTNQIEDSRKFHLEGDDGVMEPYLKPHLRLAPSESAIQQHLLTKLQSFIQKSNGFNIGDLMSDFPNNLSFQNVRSMLKRIGAPQLSHQDVDTLARLLEGQSQDEMESLFQSTYSQNQNISPCDAFNYSVDILLKGSPQVQKVKCSISKTRLKQSLVYPDDEAVMKVALRKQGVVAYRVVGFDLLNF